MKRPYILTLLTLFMTMASQAQSVLHVPADYATIQEAIDASQGLDTVLVAPGIYRENIHIEGKNVVLGSLFLTTGDPAYIDQTIIDGQGLDAVITFKDIAFNTSLLAGFTIKNGSHAPTPDFPEYGGGILCLAASPVIRNNHITSCYGTWFNYSDFGGIYCKNSEAVIIENRIDSIQAHFTSLFGGITGRHSNLTISRNVIYNTTGGYVFYGGGVSLDSCILNLDHNLIYDGFYDAPPPTASVKLHGCMAFINNNTLVGELALRGTNTVNGHSNIIQAPDAAAGIVLFEQGEPVINMTYSDIKGGWPGEGNIDFPPLFIDPTNGDYTLSPYSPCIDTGNPNLYPDPDGTRVDMGAYFFNQAVTGVPSLTVLDWKLFPNPTTDELFVTLPNDVNDVNYSILDAQGRIRQTGSFAKGQNISIRNLETGLYWLTVVTDKGEKGTCPIQKQ